MQKLVLTATFFFGPLKKILGQRLPKSLNTLKWDQNFDNSKGTPEMFHQYF